MSLKRISINIITILAILIACPSVWAATYYVDASGGNDSNPGTETTRAWKTISKVNSKSLAPGDIILFKSGQSWNETLKPSSGSSSALVTYGAYGNGDKPRISNLDASGKSYVKIEGLQIVTTNSSSAALLNNSHNITLKGCDLFASSSSGAYSVLKMTMSSNYNKIIDCHIEHLQTDKLNDTINIYYNSSYNLLEGNTIRGGTHTVLGLNGASDKYPNYEVKFNVIRNNTIVNLDARPITMATNANHNLIENNVISGGKETSYCSGGQTIKLVTSNNIFRYNVIKDNASNSDGGLSMIAYQYSNYPANQASNNRIYNNTFTNLSTNPIILGTYNPDVSFVENNVFKNNILTNNGGNQVTTRKWDSVRENLFSGNIIYKAGVSRTMFIRKIYYSVNEIEAADRSFFSGNYDENPDLGSDLKPASNSPAINGGVDLTTITSSSGNGTTFSVGDASYFSDGFKIVQGDIIAVGDSVATISSIDYVNNKITLSSPISWQYGQAVNLPHSGTRPSIGAMGSSSIPTALQPPKNLRLTSP